MAGENSIVSSLIREAHPDKFLWLEWDQSTEIIFLHDLSAEEPSVVAIPRAKVAPLVACLQGFLKDHPE
jgi:hypothetical protein